MDKDKVFMNIANEISKLSHCVSFKVGAILVKDSRILSTGINGTPRGFQNCDDLFDSENFDRTEHHKFSESFEIHAETNAILFAASNGISIKDSVMYSTHHPCNNCLKMICNSGIKKVFYAKEYDMFKTDKKIEELLKSCGVELVKIDMEN